MYKAIFFKINRTVSGWVARNTATVFLAVIAIFLFSFKMSLAYSEYGIVFDDPLSLSGKAFLKILDIMPVNFQELEKEYHKKITDPLKKETSFLLSKMVPDMDKEFGTKLDSVIKDNIKDGQTIAATAGIDAAKKNQLSDKHIVIIKESICQAFYFLFKRKFDSIEENLGNEKSQEILSLVKVTYNNVWAPIVWKESIQLDTDVRKGFKLMESSLGKPGGHFGIGRKSADKKSFNEAKKLILNILIKSAELQKIKLYDEVRR